MQREGARKNKKRKQQPENSKIITGAVVSFNEVLQ